MSFSVLICIVVFCTSALNAQQNGSEIIMEILDNLGLTQLNPLGILDETYIDRICQQVNDTERDDICFKQLKIVCQNETFRIIMMDANSKFPYTGMLVKTRLELGSYDECIGLDLTVNNTQVLGKHCTGGLIIPTTSLNDSNFLDQAYKLSTCIPHKCTAMDLLDLLGLSSVYPLFNDYTCLTKDGTPLKWDDYLVIVFFSTIFLMLIAASLCDLYFYYNHTDCPNMLIQAFSIVRNGRKLLKVSKTSNDQIKAIHGLRVFSMMWIVLGHAFSTMGSYPGININQPSNFEYSRKSIYVTTAYVAVDTFFFISGFLLAYQYLKQRPTSLVNHVKRVPSMVLHRYLRLTPVVASAFMIITTVFPNLGDGPLYKLLATVEHDRCVNQWWSFFLYIQNYLHYDDMCLIHTWYLSADWQLFLISPIILIPVAMLVKSHFKWIMGQLLILNLMFTFLPVALKFLFQDYANSYETHARLNDYFIGFMLGVFMREKNTYKYRLSKTINNVIWIIIITTMVTTLLVFKEIQLLTHSEGDDSYITYVIFLRFFWCVGLSWIIYACQNGYGGFINWLLTNSFMQVLSKLTFCMYIIHVWPIFYLYSVIRSPIEYSQLTSIKEAIVTYVVTVGSATVWTLAFESPIIAIEKHFLRNRGGTKNV